MTLLNDDLEVLSQDCFLRINNHSELEVVPDAQQASRVCQIARHLCQKPHPPQVQYDILRQLKHHPHHPHHHPCSTQDTIDLKNDLHKIFSSLFCQDFSIPLDQLPKGVLFTSQIPIEVSLQLQADPTNYALVYKNKELSLCRWVNDKMQSLPVQSLHDLPLHGQGRQIVADSTSRFAIGQGPKITPQMHTMLQVVPQSYLYLEHEGNIYAHFIEKNAIRRERVKWVHGKISFPSLETRILPNCITHIPKNFQEIAKVRKAWENSSHQKPLMKFSKKTSNLGITSSYFVKNGYVYRQVKKSETTTKHLGEGISKQATQMEDALGRTDQVVRITLKQSLFNSDAHIRKEIENLGNLKKHFGMRQDMLMENFTKYKASNGQEKYVKIEPYAGVELRSVQEKNGKLPLSSSDIACILLKACKPIQAMHQKHFIHGDIKNPNFMIRIHPQNPKESQITLIDFGFTLQLNNRENLIPKRGTVGFAAPELTKYSMSDTIKLGLENAIKIDIYAFGRTIQLFALQNCRSWNDLEPFLLLAQKCMSSDPKERPYMKKVIEELERIEQSSSDLFRKGL